MSQGSKFRIVTYNVHKCVGIDRRHAALTRISAEPGHGLIRTDGRCVFYK
jgi:hypothetical protein